MQDLTSDNKGRLGSHFVYYFESERKAPDVAPPARYTREAEVIPALFEKAIKAADNRDPDRKALLLKSYPPGLPKEK